jgi:hypothetical protein
MDVTRPSTAGQPEEIAGTYLTSVQRAGMSEARQASSALTTSS